MSKDVRTALIFACRRVLEPLIRILLRGGVSAGEFKSLVDSIYVHQGVRHLRKNGEGVSDSRLATITGLQRHAIPRVLAQPQDEFAPRSGTQLHRASRVLTGWYEDAEFRSPSGDPAVLPVNGRGASFQTLVDRYGGGVPAAPVLKELLHQQVVRRLPKKRILVLRRTPEPVGTDPAVLYDVAQLSGDLLNTLDHNMASPATAVLPVRSMVAPMDAAALPLFRAQMRKRADGLMETTESFLAAYPPKTSRAAPHENPAATVTAGIAVFALLRLPKEPDETTESKASSARKNPGPRRLRGAQRED